MKATIAKLVGVIAVVLIVGVIVYFSLTPTENFYVTHDSAELLPTTENIVAVQSGQGYYFGCIAVTGSEGFNVYVVPSEKGRNLKFSIDGTVCSFDEGEDLTAGFDIETYQTGFILIIQSDLTLQSLLEKVYVGYSVQVDDSAKLAKNFALLVVPKNNAPAITISLSFSGGEA